MKENRSKFLCDSFAKNVGNDEGGILKEKLLLHPHFGPLGGLPGAKIGPKLGPEQVQNGD